MVQMMGQDETQAIANHKYICNHFLVVHLAGRWPQIGLTGREFRDAIENTVSGVASMSRRVVGVPRVQGSWSRDCEIYVRRPLSSGSPYYRWSCQVCCAFGPPLDIGCSRSRDTSTIRLESPSRLQTEALRGLRASRAHDGLG